ncbi:MAG: O-succinylbenzoic acid--CoA ligase [Flavobacteriaceae bacterium]|nr:O-succinylbenzoic acid--CoA ligase [Flavobacteriaceae bacterium]
MQLFHPSFTFNGLHYESADELLHFAKKLKDHGDDYEIHMGKFLEKWLGPDTHILVKTSGSTGKPKKISLSKSAMIHSARATATYFKLGENTSALLCLPANFIAGKMMLVRAMVLGWQLHVVAPEKDALTQYDNDYDFVAMVPYQVYFSLPALKKVKKLIIGGGPITSDLEQKLQHVPTEAFATYGMTETVTHIAIRRINGPARTEVFSALPTVKFSVDTRNCLRIQAPGIIEEDIVTNDVVKLISATSFEWLGRYDNVINSGAVKVFPEKVEEKLAAHITYPFIIASEIDEALGERIILILEKRDEALLPNYAQAFATLHPYEKPKRIYTVSEFPYTETGKVKRNDVIQMLRKYK